MLARPGYVANPGRMEPKISHIGSCHRPSRTIREGPICAKQPVSRRSLSLEAVHSKLRAPQPDAVCD